VCGGQRCRRTWARRSTGTLQIARRGIHGCAPFEVAHSDDLLSRPNLEGEGAGSPAKDGIRAVIVRAGGNDTAAPDPDEAGAEEISWELTEQLAAQIVSRQRKRRRIQRFWKFF
jgi:hypothetical protein